MIDSNFKDLKSNIVDLQRTKVDQKVTNFNVEAGFSRPLQETCCHLNGKGYNKLYIWYA